LLSIFIEEYPHWPAGQSSPQQPSANFFSALQKKNKRGGKYENIVKIFSTISGLRPEIGELTISTKFPANSLIIIRDITISNDTMKVSTSKPTVNMWCDFQHFILGETHYRGDQQICYYPSSFHLLK
jgi:hypothetical protein